MRWGDRYARRLISIAVVTTAWTVIGRTRHAQSFVTTTRRAAWIPLQKSLLIRHDQMRDAQRCGTEVKKTCNTVIRISRLGQDPRFLLPLSAMAGRGMSDREREIQRKIAMLKQQGLIKKAGNQPTTGDQTANDDDDDDDDDEEVLRIFGDDERDVSLSSGIAVPAQDEVYVDKIRSKLGAARSNVLGFTSSTRSSAERGNQDDCSSSESVKRQAQLGSLSPVVDESLGTPSISPGTASSSKPSLHPSIRISPELFANVPPEDEDINEESLLDLVAQKMIEKRARERRDGEQRMKERAQERLAAIEAELQNREELWQGVASESSSEGGLGKNTTGVGGTWNENRTAETDLYQPSVGTWGAFPRPRDISKAYGGGRRVGAGYMDTDALLRQRQSADETRERLRRYREKVGIEVESEKLHAAEIDEALQIGNRAMQRGIYSTAVSALEKVTQYCSTNSRVGGKVFLELAMAYEAVGRSEEAITVYTTLSRSRIEEIKLNAKRLLYGIEAMQFMQNDLRRPEFSRRGVRNTFIETTGFDNIASKFDNVYATAYIDLESGFYKRLTESVVRSCREARQVLLRATSAGEVPRMRIVQALRALARRFDDALQEEMKRNAPVQMPVAVLDGKPILPTKLDNDHGNDLGSVIAAMDGFVLADAVQMKRNLNGEWRLQLLADKTGDGVKFFNSTLSWQKVNMDKLTFLSSSPSGFVTVQQSGSIEFNDRKRILRRTGVEVSGGGMFAGLFSPSTYGSTGAVRAPQQILSVDSILLITRCVSSKRVPAKKDEAKDFFAVWRRVEPGTYSNTNQYV